MIAKIKSMVKSLSKNKLIKIGAVGGVIIISIATIIILNIQTPTLVLNGPKGKIELGDNKEIIVPVTLSKLPEENYPAASASIKFDERKLEFVGVELGTMESYDNYDDKSDANNVRYKIPNWTYNVEAANRDGVINTMYVDTTAGKNGYIKEGFEKDKKDIPFKLVFKLKYSALPGEKIELKINDASFATVNGEEDKTSLSTKENYSKLKVKPTYIVVAK
ncbi:MAG: cohesin domain-containing protein [Clostridium sp.]